jgi:hypothetical protein
VPPATASAIAKQEADGTLSVWVPDGAAGYTAEDSPFLGATTEQSLLSFSDALVFLIRNADDETRSFAKTGLGQTQRRRTE